MSVEWIMALAAGVIFALPALFEKDKKLNKLLWFLIAFVFVTLLHRGCSAILPSNNSDGACYDRQGAYEC